MLTKRLLPLVALCILALSASSAQAWWRIGIGITASLQNGAVSTPSANEMSACKAEKLRTR